MSSSRASHRSFFFQTLKMSSDEDHVMWLNAPEWLLNLPPSEKFLLLFPRSEINYAFQILFKSTRTRNHSKENWKYEHRCQDLCPELNHLQHIREPMELNQRIIWHFNILIVLQRVRAEVSSLVFLFFCGGQRPDKTSGPRLDQCV